MRSSDLDSFARFLLLFYQEQPVDFLFTYFPQILSHPAMPMRTPTLFQHQGLYSSYSYKNTLNNLKDSYFAENAGTNRGSQIVGGDNPVAVVSTTLKPFQSHTINRAYAKTKDFFWSGQPPTDDDTVTISYTTAIYINRIVITTGNISHPSDILREGALSASPNQDCSSSTTVGHFFKGHLDISDVYQTVPAIRCLRISMKAQSEWLIIQQIQIFLQKWTILLPSFLHLWNARWAIEIV